MTLPFSLMFNLKEKQMEKEVFKTFVALVPKSSHWTYYDCTQNLACSWSVKEMKDEMPQGSKLVRLGNFEGALANGQDLSKYHIRFVDIMVNENDYVFDKIKCDRL